MNSDLLRGNKKYSREIGLTSMMVNKMIKKRKMIQKRPKSQLSITEATQSIVEATLIAEVTLGEACWALHCLRTTYTLGER